MSKTKPQSRGSTSSFEDTPTNKEIDNMNIKYENPSVAGQFKDFLKTVVTFTGDLSALTCPAFFLNGQSLLEYSTYWGDHPEIFAAISESTDPADRMLAVTRWFMSTLYGDYASRCDKGQSEKKPYNPVLGERFFCTFEDTIGTGETICICEQVSHHPPISAFYLENKKAGVSINGHCGQKSKFKGTSIKVEQLGRVTLHLRNPSESYLVTFPDLYIRSLFTGSPFLDLSGTSSIVSSTGYVATIEYIPKPWFTGQHHQIKGSIHSPSGKETHTLSGRWNTATYYTPAGSHHKQLLFDADASPMAARVTAPLDQQDQLETHKLWGAVTAALKEKNYTLANAEKNRIEEAQRVQKKEREKNSEKWEPKLFMFEEDGDENDVEVKMKKQAKMSSVMGGGLDSGTWVYKESLHLKQ